MIIKKSFLVFLLMAILCSSAYSQLSVVKMVGKNSDNSKLGFGLFGYWSIPLNDIGNRNLMIESFDAAYFPRKQISDSIFVNNSANAGFFLNGKALKILGVCNHHDLGALGAAVNSRAIQRQLVILKAMGCNAIRTAHNPPSVELLDLCDSMGFIVMDEAFDMWKKAKNKYDYSLDWDQWHAKDLQDHCLKLLFQKSWLASLNKLNR